MIKLKCKIHVFFTSGVVVKYDAFDYAINDMWFTIEDKHNTTYIPAHSIDEVKVEVYDND